MYAPVVLFTMEVARRMASCVVMGGSAVIACTTNDTTSFPVCQLVQVHLGNLFQGKANPLCSCVDVPELVTQFLDEVLKVEATVPPALLDYFQRFTRLASTAH